MRARRLKTSAHYVVERMESGMFHSIQFDNRQQAVAHADMVIQRKNCTHVVIRECTPFMELGGRD